MNPLLEQYLIHLQYTKDAIHNLKAALNKIRKGKEFIEQKH